MFYRLIEMTILSYKKYQGCRFSADSRKSVDFLSSWVIFEIDVNSTKAINSFVIFHTVPKNRHASAFIVTLAAYGMSVSAFLIGQIESFPAFYFRITNQITVYIVALVCCQNTSKCRIFVLRADENLKSN
jgi:hypothetical protein